MPEPFRPSTCRMRMPSIFSIGLTLSRTMPSICSSSLRLNSEARAGSVSTFSAPLVSFCAPASTAPLGPRADPGFLRGLLGEQPRDRLAPLRDLALAHGDGLLHRLGRARLGVFRLDLRGRLLQRFLIERDRLLHQRSLDDPLAIDFELAKVALARDARLVDAAIGSDARPLDVLARRDLGFLQRLDARDLQLLDCAATLQTSRLHHLLALDVALFDLL